jgi:hypothetical protein
MTSDEIRAAAERVGLPLSQEEAERMVTGVTRSRRLADSLREQFMPDIEPATVFAADRSQR